MKMNGTSLGFIFVLIASISVLIYLYIFHHEELMCGKVHCSTSEAISTGKLDPTAQKTSEEWKKQLTPEQYHILREAGTETPFSGSLLHESRKGTFYSYGCDKPLFRSEDKYDSRTGWPSFTKPISVDAVVLQADNSLGTERTEVLDLCGGHLGHVFDDGPKPTGQRYCMNSAALYFVEDK